MQDREVPSHLDVGTKLFGNVLRRMASLKPQQTLDMGELNYYVRVSTVLVGHARTKHIDIRHHFVREVVPRSVLDGLLTALHIRFTHRPKYKNKCPSGDTSFIWTLANQLMFCLPECHFPASYTEFTATEKVSKGDKAA